MSDNDSTRSSRPLDSEALERIAFHYVARYATSSAKLRSYLQRKLRTRGVVDGFGGDVAAIVEKMVELGFVNDAAYAEMQASSLTRRGYGARRIDVALRQAGIAETVSRDLTSVAEGVGVETAHSYAKRRRLGPYSAKSPSRDERQRVIAALMRAGHCLDDARAVIIDWREGRGDS